MISNACLTRKFECRWTLKIDVWSGAFWAVCPRQLIALRERRRKRCTAPQFGLLYYCEIIKSNNPSNSNARWMKEEHKHDVHVYCFSWLDFETNTRSREKYHWFLHQLTLGWQWFARCISSNIGGYICRVITCKSFSLLHYLFIYFSSYCFRILLFPRVNLWLN